MKEEIKRKYVKELLGYNKDYADNRHLYQGKEKAIYNYISKIVDNNLDYLLKKSFLIHLACSDYMLIDLHSLSSDDSSRRRVIIDYFAMEVSYLVDGFNDCLVIGNMEEDEKNALYKAASVIGNLKTTFKKYHYRIMDAKGIVYTVLAYCYINNKMNDFNEIIDYFMNDPYKILDDLYMNDIVCDIGIRINDDYSKFYERIFNLADSISKPKIH